jgi:hypothetical protein
MGRSRRETIDSQTARAIRNKSGIEPATGGADGSAPLKYTEFLADAGGDHQAAMQSAVNTLFSASGSYRRYLDLEGAQVLLNSPVTFTGSGTGDVIRTIANGEIAPSPSWSGDHLLSTTGIGSGNLRFINLTFDGNGQASWFRWDGGGLHVTSCFFRHSKDNGVPGLQATGEGGYKIFNSSFISDEFPGNPEMRNRIAISSPGSDNKIFNCTLAHFKHGIVNGGGTFTLGNCHVYQGIRRSQDITGHTAGIKLTGGYVGSLIADLYLDKCFIEISNETDAATTKIGGLVITGMKTLATSGESSFAYVVAKDYQNKTGMTVEDITITGCHFTNFGSAFINCTNSTPPASFDRKKFRGILMSDNTFQGANLRREANPCTMEATFASATTQHTISFSRHMPFGIRPNKVKALAGVPTSGASNTLYVGKVSRGTSEVRVDTNAAWAGTIVCTVTGNPSESEGFIDG